MVIEVDKLQLARMRGDQYYHHSSKSIHSYNIRIWTLEIELKICLVEYAKLPDDTWGLVSKPFNLGG